MTDLGDKAKERFLRETKPPEVEGVKIDWSPLPHPGIRDLRGMRFGKLLVKAYSHTREQANGIPCVYWMCQCDCGNDRPVARDQLLRKGTSSCGCLAIGGNKGILNASKTHQKRSHMTKRMRYGLPPVAPTEVIGDPANVFAYDSLMAYACLQWAGYIPAAHHHLIAKYLEKVEKGKIKRLMIFMPPRHGKECAHSTPILTAEGWKTHGELKVGDRVYHPSGCQTTVIAESYEHHQDDYLVQVSTGEVIRCHENHEWVVFDSYSGIWHKKETKDFVYQDNDRFVLPHLCSGFQCYIDFYHGEKRSIISVKYSPNGELGKCIQVESPDGLYVVGKSFIPTHNSMIISEYFPAWYLGRNPEKRVVCASYGQELASEFGRKVRNQIADPMYGEIFPNIGLSGDSAAADKFDLSPPHRGGYFAVGAGGALTGKGANCFSGETLIATEDGFIDIATLVKLEYRPRVLSFNHENNTLEFSRILATQESIADELVEIRTLGRRSIRVTRDHVVYDDKRGYRAAEVFKPGDRLVSCEIKVKQDLCEMRSREERPWLFMQELLQRSAESFCGLKMREVRDGIFKTEMRVREAIKKETRRFLLFCEMFTGASRNKKSPSLQNLQYSSREKRQTVLQWMSPKVRRKEGRVSAYKSYLSNLQCGVYGKMAWTWACKVRTVLQQAMFGNWSFSKNDWRGESSLDSWANPFTEATTLCAGLSNNAASYIEERQQHLRLLRGDPKENACSSFKWEANKQSFVKSGHALRGMSLPTSCGNGLWAGYDEVESVVRVCEKTVVYDIQIESNHNLFANGILCHNCLIIDDILKNSEEADSEAHRRKLIDWYTAVAYTRLMDDGAIVLVMTRWHIMDLAGWLLKEHKHEKWTVLNLPAINEQGEALWPERFPVPVLEQIRKTLPNRHWMSLYQQKPFIEEGNIYKRQWWNLWPDTKPLPECEFIIQSWDTAYSDKDRKQSSYSARVTLGVFKRPDDEFHNVILIEYWKGRVEYPELRKESLRAYQDYEPDKVIIEKRASGQTLIQDLRRGGLPLATYTPEKDKITRAYAAQSLLENGRLYYPARKWAEEFISALARFPNPDDDDVADAFSQAIIWLQSSFLVSHADDAKRRQREDEEDEDLPSNVTRFKPKKKRAAYG